MNAFNRLLAVLFLLASVALITVFLLCWAGWLDAQTLGLLYHVRGLLEQGLGLARQDPATWGLSTAGLLVICLLMLFLELRHVRPERTLLLEQSAAGATTLDIAAIADLVRWLGESTDGVEEMKGVRVKRKEQTLYVTGLAMLNPFVSAPATARVLQYEVQTGVSRASGFPVQVHLRSRFQDPRVRRKAV